MIVNRRIPSHQSLCGLGFHPQTLSPHIFSSVSSLCVLWLIRKQREKISISTQKLSQAMINYRFGKTLFGYLHYLRENSCLLMMLCNPQLLS